MMSTFGREFLMLSGKKGANEEVVKRLVERKTVLEKQIRERKILGLVFCLLGVISIVALFVGQTELKSVFASLGTICFVFMVISFALNFPAKKNLNSVKVELMSKDASLV